MISTVRLRGMMEGADLHWDPSRGYPSTWPLLSYPSLLRDAIHTLLGSMLSCRSSTPESPQDAVPALCWHMGAKAIAPPMLVMFPKELFSFHHIFYFFWTQAVHQPEFHPYPRHARPVYWRACYEHAKSAHPSHASVVSSK